MEERNQESEMTKGEESQENRTTKVEESQENEEERNPSGESVRTRGNKERK